MAKKTGRIAIPKGINKRDQRQAVRDEQKVKQELAAAGAGLPSQIPSKKTQDSFTNFALKLGIGTDNALSLSSYSFNPITRIRVLLEWIHRGSWMGGVAIDLVADDMTRAGIDLQSTVKPELIEKIKQAAVRWRIWPAINETVKWARLYGGSICFIMIDGQDPATPLRIETVQKGQFRGLLPLDRWMVDALIGTGDLVTEMGPEFGNPKFYRTIIAPGIPYIKIHYSRVIRLEGIRLPYNQRIMENLWGLSVIERLYDRMVAFDSASMGVAQLMYKAHYRILKVEGLREIAATGGTAYQGLLALTALMAKFQSIEGTTLIDTKDEYEGTEGGASGIAGVGEGLEAMANQLAGALQIPMTRLFGQSPGGLNSTGESDLRMYYDGIKQQQESELKVGVHKVYRVMSASEGIKLGDDFDFEFRSLWQMTDQQSAEVSARDTESILAAEERGVISKQVALEEMRQRGRSANRWSNITDKDINKADDEPAAPAMEAALKGEGVKPESTKMPAVKQAAKRPSQGDRAFLPPMVAKAVEEPEIDWEHDVRTLANASKAGGKTYIDRRVDKEINIVGRRLETAQPLNLHEQYERFLVVVMGMSDDEAHEIATQAEREWFIENGFGEEGWKAWTRYIDGKLAHIEHEGVRNPPPDPYVTTRTALGPGHHHSINKLSVTRDHDYNLPMLDYCGLPVIIEAFKGEKRWADGPAQPADYGHFWGTGSAEGKHEGMDVFVGPYRDMLDHGPLPVYVIDQYDKRTGEFDEAKCFIGFRNEQEAKDCWDDAYGTFHVRRGGCTTLDVASLATWMRTANLREPLSTTRGPISDRKGNGNGAHPAT
jgi:phage-related protein (TIGR01555 family)